MSEINLENALTIKNIALGFVTAGIIPLSNHLYKIWKDNAPEREARRKFRLEKYKIRMDAKHGGMK